MRLSASALALVLLTSSMAFAQEPPAAEMPPPAEAPPPPAAPEATPPPPAPVPVVTMAPPPPMPEAMPAPAAAPAAPGWKELVTVEGLVDSYYMLNFKGDPTTTPPGGRAFDVTSNNFALNYAKLGVGFSAENVGGRIDIGYGQIGAIINGFSASGSAGAGGSLYTSALIVQQAYASLTLGILTLDFGKFVTNSGAEVIEANKNWLYSRSFLFNSIPFLHTGVRGNLKFSDQFTLVLSVVNGWNNDPDETGDKTFGASAFVTPTDQLSLALNAYVGKETSNPITGTMDTHLNLDLVAGFTVSDQLALNLNFDYVKFGDPYLWGIAVMGRLMAAEHLALAIRGEFLKDHGLYGLAADSNIFEGTVGAALPFGGHYELRGELRGDFSGDDVFTTGTEVTSSQFTGTVAALAFF